MKARLQQLLACPQCKGDHTLKADQSSGDEILVGLLRCSSCGVDFPIRGGIPRFVGGDAYAESFGDEWHRFRTVQLDSANGSRECEDGFRLKTGLGPDDVRGRLVLDAGVGAGRYAEVMSHWGG